MGAISPDKVKYDKFAADYFDAIGWRSCYGYRHKRSCDLIAINSDSIAIVEVKSPKEIGCSSSYNDTKDMSIIPEGFQARRNNLIVTAKRLPRKGRALVRLYLVTIGCQLYRYWLEFEQKIHLYHSELQQSFSSGHLIRAFLVVPLENQPRLQKALELSQENQTIESFNLKPSSDQLCVAEVKYSQK